MARPRLGRNSNIDIHELMKREAFDHADGTSFDANHFERQRPAPGGVVGVSDQYVILDSFLKTQTSDTANGQFHWNFMVQGVTGNQVIGVHDRVDTVIEIQFGQILMPPLPPFPYTVTASGVNSGIILTQNNNYPTPQAMSYGVSPSTISGGTNIAQASSWAFDPESQLSLGIFTIQIEEAGLQSISDYAGTRHHLDYSINVSNQRPASYGFTAAVGETSTGAIVGPLPLIAAPLGMSGSEWDTYVFTEPLKDVHGLTLRFRGPDEALHFAPDCYYNTVFKVDANSVVNFTVTTPYGLSVGDRVILRDFKSGIKILDDYMSNQAGIVVTHSPPVVIPSPPIIPTNSSILGSAIPPVPGSNPTAYQYYFDPSPSIAGLVAPNSIIATGVTVCVLKYRMRVPIRMRRVVQRLTNYKGP